MLGGIFGFSPKTSADSCTNAYAGFTCQDARKFPNSNVCYKGLCPGDSNNLCCPNYIKCKDDGSTGLRPCLTEGGSPGVCNGAGVCIASGAGSSGQSQASNSSSGNNAGGSASTNCAPDEICFGNPIRVDSIEGLLGNFLGVLQRIIVVLSIIFIVIGAIMYMTSMGDTGQIGKAKNAITAAIVGLAIALAAPSFLKEVLLIIGQDPGQVGGALSLSQIAVRVLNFLLSISGVIAMIMMVVGAIMYLTAAGDTKDIDKGKAIFKWSVIGVIVALSALIIVRQVAALLAV